MQVLKITIYYLTALRKASSPVLIVFILFILWTYDSFAQTGIISGQIKNEEIALQSATISVATHITVTDSNGEFSIEINPGTYILVVTYPGYNNYEHKIIINAGETQTIRINMIRAELLDEIVILGSRSVVQRSNLNTAVPLDLITAKELIQTGQQSLIQMLNFAVPSFNVSRQNLSEPVTLRGLSPDHLLILLNGARYHNPAGINPGAIRGTLGRGSVGNILNSIPLSAIDKIEILRDGASAQYGSDAIAGVMNIELKKTIGKTNINLHTGQHYKGDGASLVFGINHGFPIGKKHSDSRPGYLNFSGDMFFRNPTYRGGEYQGTVYYQVPSNTNQSVRDSITALDNIKIQQRGFSRKTPVSNDGSIQFTSYGFLLNGGYSISSLVELFWTGAVNYRQPVYTGLYRFPKDSNQVNTVLYPDGFRPKIISNNWDISGITGAKGTTNKGWNWEWNSVYGKNSGLTYLKNTNNASQVASGADAPTEFYSGSNAFIQQTNTISFAKDFAKELRGVKTFNIGLGAEYRFENIRTRQGEEASWQNYDASGRTQVGVQPSPGIHPRDEVSESRTVAGLYIDLETDITNQMFINMSGRYEHYNDFANNLAGKLALRYKLSSSFSLRGSLSNGYHAPALQQIYYSSINTGSRNVGGVNIPVLVGLFSNNSAVTQAFGIKQLQPEKAVNLSGGFTSTVSPHINLTVDAYWIQIKNRIVLSGRFDRSNPVVNGILVNLPDIDGVQFITNAINTRTRGLDIIMNGNWKFRKASFGLILAANFSDLSVFGPIQATDKLPADSLNTNTLFNREEREKIEHGQPGSKIISSMNYKRGKLEFLIRNTRFGKTSAVFNSANKSQDELFSPKTLTDFIINYSPKTWFTITVGANNVFDVYPDRLKNYDNTNQGILIYSNEAIQFGYNGGYYFLNMALNF